MTMITAAKPSRWEPRDCSEKLLKEENNGYTAYILTTTKIQTKIKCSNSPYSPHRASSQSSLLHNWPLWKMNFGRIWQIWQHGFRAYPHCKHHVSHFQNLVTPSSVLIIHVWLFTTGIQLPQSHIKNWTQMKQDCFIEQHVSKRHWCTVPSDMMHCQANFTIGGTCPLPFMRGWLHLLAVYAS